MNLARRILRTLATMAAGAILWMFLAHAFGPDGRGEPRTPSATVRIFTTPDGCEYIATPNDQLKPHMDETGRHICCRRPELIQEKRSNS